MGLGTPLDIASQVNEGYLSGANWTLQNNDFDSYAYGSAALSTKTGSVVSIDGSSSGALEDDVDNFEIRRNIGNIAADTNFSIKGISNIYVDTSATCTLTVDVYEDASTTPVKINDLSASVSLSTTSGIEKSGQILSLTTYSASAYSDVEIRLTIETEITSGNATIIVIDLTDFEIYVSVPYVQTTATSYTLFNSKSTYLQWDKENFVIKGVDLNADEATIGNLVVDGTTVFRGDVTVAGSLASHPNITGAADVDNSNGVVLQDLDFDAFGHVLSTGTVDLDSRYIQITPSADEQTVNSDLTIIGRVTVQGNLTTVDSSVVTTSDNIIGINEGEVSAGISAVYGGMELDRGTLNPQRLIFRETDDLWRAGEFTGSITYTAGSGTFQVGEAISGTGSGAGATIISDSGTVLTIKNINGAFADAETIVGQTSGADATVDSSTKIDSTLRLAFIQDSPIDTAVSYFDSSTGTLKTSSDFT